MKRLKVLVTGCGGMLGTDLMAALARDFEPVGLDLPELDITNKDRIIKTITGLKPGLVIHTAAFTDVDGCEKEPEKAYQVNALGTANVVIACQKLKSPLVYISTDYVFDGKKGKPYLESDPPNPIQVYGRSKLDGEFYTRNLLDRFFIIRTAGLYGKYGKSFPAAILNQINAGKSLRVVQDQIVSPTFTQDLAQGIIKVIRNNGYGVYHITNEGALSWYGFACAIVKAVKGKAKVRAVTSQEMKRTASRPAYSVLENSALKSVVGYQMPEWSDALKRYLKALL
ncbi:MAG: dTDP-4-dehydrorhamnose reductase [Candidatus Omnitrophota bacterium]